MKAPIDVTNFSQALKLPRDSESSGDFWLLLDSGQKVVYLAEQPVGGEVVQKITIPKRHFDALVRFYTTGSKRKPATT